LSVGGGDLHPLAVLGEVNVLIESPHRVGGHGRERQPGLLPGADLDAVSA
jgi:hypothetical protein